MNLFKSWEAMLAVVLVVELIVLGLINPAFLNIENLLFSTSDFVHVIIAAVGLTLVIMTGGMDISGVSIMGLASIVLGLMFVAGVPIGFAVIAALAVGLGAGAFNGTVIAKTDINPLVVTLAMLFLYAGIATGLPTLLDMLGSGAGLAGGFEAYQ
ncbi:MAG: autoinducer 2 import system permease LsrD, partial [Maritimibacter sp.]|nr:autoinducer 2 import system permease LsrD [Maritimibacter sp.]